MAPFSGSRSSTTLWESALLSCLLLMISTLSSSHQFRAGGERGWIQPTANLTRTYNDWAAMNRFHVGDTIYFKYEKNEDSVVQVDRKGYANCDATNPIARFDDGNTYFRFHRHGFFYFISGQPGHCVSGQKLIVRVMVHPAEEEVAHPPKAAPPPASNIMADGPQSSTAAAASATTKLSPAAASSVTALGALLLLLLPPIIHAFIL